MTGASPAAAVRAERASASEDGRLLFRNVSLVLPAGGITVLLGQRSAADAFLQCLAGRRRLAEGRIEVLGLDPSRRWRLRGRRVFLPAGSTPAPRRPRPELLLFEEPERPSAEFPAWIRDGAAAGMTVVFTSGNGSVSERAERAALFSRGRLVAEGTIGELLGGFRRVRFVNRLTETRTAFGTELDEFDAVRVRVRGWGIEAVVANFDPSAFERLRAVDGVSETEAEPMTLSEISEACAEGA